ncbi:MAG: hypothetical protein AABZ30_12615 [Myxococcota bacterium]
MGAATFLIASVVMVRGHASLEVDSIERAATEVLVSGHLRDAELFTGLPGRAVEGRLSGKGGGEARAQVATTAGGAFTLSLPGAPLATGEAAAVELGFAGDEGYLAARAGPIAVDGERLAVALVMRGPAEIVVSGETRGGAVGASTQALAISARAGGAAVSLPILVEDERGREIAQAKSLPARIEIDSLRLGAPGPARLIARFAGDRRYAPAEAMLDTTVVTEVRVTLASDDDLVRLGREIAVGGEVHDAAGPVAGAAVSILVQGALAQAATTDALGRFAARLETDGWPPGRVEIHARTQSDVPWRRAGLSSAVRVRIAARSSLDARALGVLTAACAAALALLALARLREGRVVAAPSATLASTGLLPVLAAGERPASPFDLGVELLLWDGFDAHPIAGGRLVIGGRAHVAGVDGRIAILALPAGAHEATVEAPGYAPCRVRLSVPHRGELRGARVALRSARAEALACYRDAVEPTLGSAWRLRTPGEVAVLQPALAETCASFAARYFGGST